MLLVPTTLMGATLPLLSAALCVPPVKSTSVTRLYTRNLVGAIVGCLVAGFLLLPCSACARRSTSRHQSTSSSESSPFSWTAEPKRDDTANAFRLSFI